MKFETQRLIIRKPRLSDWKDIFEGVREFDVAKTTKNIPHPYSKKDAQEFLKKSLEKWKKKESYVFAIELKSEKKVIGLISLDNISKFNGHARTGSWINKNYWRRGYITEAKIVVNDFAFNKLNLRRLDSQIFINNKTSNAVQKKLGYIFEGTRRKYFKSKSTGKIYDVNFYGLLKKDWKKARPRVVKKLKEKIRKLER